LILQGFVADSILSGFNPNQEPIVEAHYAAHGHTAAAQGFFHGPQSAPCENATSAAAEQGDEMSSQPLVPYIGMVFDDLEVAKQVYKEYAFKLGFGIRIANTKYSQPRRTPRNTILSMVFECIHAGKTPDEATELGSKKKMFAAKGIEDALGMSNETGQKSKKKQSVEEMDVADTRQQNKVLRHECKVHMIVGKQDRAWTVTVFTAEHMHPLVSQIGWRRYYRSHRKVPGQDFQLLQTLHNQNINTAKIIGCLGDVHGGDPRRLGYVKQDISNIRTMLREEVTLKDMSLTIEYFEKRQAENPHFSMLCSLTVTMRLLGYFGLMAGQEPDGV
jgi:hypothetical protein